MYKIRIQGGDMVYLLALFFVAIGIYNLIITRDIRIRPGINKMDIISMIMVAVIFFIAAYLLKFEIIQTIILCLAVIFYMLASRYSRGITDEGAMISGASPLFSREYKFSQLKQVNISNDKGLVNVAIVAKDKNYVDIQRYPIRMKPDLVKVFKAEKVNIVYK